MIQYRLNITSRNLYYSLRQLTQLEKLVIRESPLNTLPEGVSSLTSLKELEMRRCTLSTLPEGSVCHRFFV